MGGGGEAGSELSPTPGVAALSQPTGPPSWSRDEAGRGDRQADFRPQALAHLVWHRLGAQDGGREITWGWVEEEKPGPRPGLRRPGLVGAARSPDVPPHQVSESSRPEQSPPEAAQLGGGRGAQGSALRHSLGFVAPSWPKGVAAAWGKSPEPSGPRAG